MSGKSRKLCIGVDEDPYRYKYRDCARMKPNGGLKFNQHK